MGWTAYKRSYIIQSTDTVIVSSDNFYLAAVFVTHNGCPNDSRSFDGSNCKAYKTNVPSNDLSTFFGAY